MRLIILALVLSLASCGTPSLQTPPPVSGTSSFDTKILTSLHDVQVGIEAARAIVVKDFPQFKDQMNGLIASYNVAMNSYKLYSTSHDASQQQSIQLQVNSLIAGVAALTVQIKK